jgi:iron(II)-dependent oxidoreductase
MLPALLIAVAADASAQPASENTPPPKFPAAIAFDAKAHPASARQQQTMVRVPAGTYTIGSPASHPLADKLALPEHKVTLKAFRLDRTEVTNTQFAEFLNALPVKLTGTALGGKVSGANIPAEQRAMLLEFNTRPAAYTMIDLDDAEALIGVRDGRFAPNPGAENHPVTETTWAGALAYCNWR